MFKEQEQELINTLSAIHSQLYELSSQKEELENQRQQIIGQIIGLRTAESIIKPEEEKESSNNNSQLVKQSS